MPRLWLCIVGLLALLLGNNGCTTCDKKIHFGIIDVLVEDGQGEPAEASEVQIRSSELADAPWQDCAPREVEIVGGFECFAFDSGSYEIRVLRDEIVVGEADVRVQIPKCSDPAPRSVTIVVE